MDMSFCDLKNKEVINIKNGCRLGNVDDICFDSETANIKSLIIFGRLKCFGLFGREENIIICWDEIEMFGEDTVLINPKRRLDTKKMKRSHLKNLFGFE